MLMTHPLRCDPHSHLEGSYTQHIRVCQDVVHPAGTVQQLCLKLAEALVPAAMACIQLGDPGSAAGIHSWASSVLLPAMAAWAQHRLCVWGVQVVAAWAVYQAGCQQG